MKLLPAQLSGLKQKVKELLERWCYSKRILIVAEFVCVVFFLLGFHILVKIDCILRVWFIYVYGICLLQLHPKSFPLKSPRTWCRMRSCWLNVKCLATPSHPSPGSRTMKRSRLVCITSCTHMGLKFGCRTSFVFVFRHLWKSGKASGVVQEAVFRLDKLGCRKLDLLH